MDYKPEELLALITRLSEKYTSKESSSVTYETARRLMEAVVYCIEEGLGTDKNQILAKEWPDCETAYQQGYTAIIEKTYKAKAVYERILDKFYDYRCQNYRETIIEGIPAFFLHYDAKYAPQDHLLTLDYPTLAMRYDKCGIRLILEYLDGVEQEMNFLRTFSAEAVCELLERILPEYKSTYMGNICEPVLLNIIGLVIADRPIHSLLMGADDYQEIKDYFGQDSKERIQQKINGIIGLVLKKLHKTGMTDYFQKVSGAYAVRIKNGIRNDSLGAVFGD